MNTTLNYSPNFDKKKRRPEEIKFIIFHYTGMKKEENSIDRLTSNKSKVSSHYFIKKSGEILTLVPDLYIAWHAGKSSWKHFKSLNKYSLGIEISNPGHNNKYEHFNKKQIKSILKLSKYLIKKYKINQRFILGHSDVAPERKKDPGEKFPWRFLSNSKIGYWHNLNYSLHSKERKQKINTIHKDVFFKNLNKIGYAKKYTSEKKYSIFLVKAFQRRFRPELVNGIIDKECFIISKNLLKKF